MASSRVPAEFDLDNDAGGSAPTPTTETATNTVNPGRGGRGRGRGKRTSEVWNDFDLVIEYDADGNAVEHDVCKKCKHTYNASSSNGTNHMRRHIPKCPGRSVNTDLFQPTIYQTLKGNTGTFSYDALRAREADARYLASAQLPLSMGEDPAFEAYIRTTYNL